RGDEAPTPEGCGALEDLLASDAEEPAGAGRRCAADRVLPAGGPRAVRRAVPAGRDGPRALLPPTAHAAMGRCERRVPPDPARAPDTPGRSAQLPLRRERGRRTPAALLRSRGALSPLLDPADRRAPVRRRCTGARLPARHRLVRARPVLAPALRRADFADGRACRHCRLV